MTEMSSAEKFFVNTFNERLGRKGIRDAFDHIDLPKGAELLELGAGKGVASYLAFNKYHPRRLVVTDYDPSQVGESRRYFERKVGGLPDTIEFRTVDALNLPFDEARFDMVFGFVFLHHLEEHQWQFRMIPKGLDEIRRVLRPGGIFVYGEMYEKRAIRRYLKSKGLQEVFSSRPWILSDLCAYRKPKEEGP